MYKLLPTRVPLYSGYMRPLEPELITELRDIIPSPKYRLANMLLCSIIISLHCFICSIQQHIDITFLYIELRNDVFNATLIHTLPIHFKLSLLRNFTTRKSSTASFALISFKYIVLYIKLYLKFLLIMIYTVLKVHGRCSIGICRILVS